MDVKSMVHLISVCQKNECLYIDYRDNTQEILKNNCNSDIEIFLYPFIFL